MSIEKGESSMADMQQSRAPHADRERTHGNPARRAVVLVGHGGVPRDYPRERLTQLRGLEAGRRLTKAPSSPQEVALETELRQWPRTPATDPYQAGLKSLAAHLRPLLEPARLVLAYNEFCAPTVAEAVRALATEGVTDIVAVPSMFTPGPTRAFVV